MIDPGHGGEDPGAIGRRHRTREKDVVLAIARILRQELNEIEGVDLIGGVNLSNKDKQIARILMDMSMTSQVSDSMVYGARILNELSRINQLHRGKVEQANFAVLKAPDIPSVLVETAFLSHPEEEKKLRTRAFQRKLAYAIGNGILKGFGHKSRLG